MKRSSGIILPLMRKHFSLNKLALSVAAIGLTGCTEPDSKQDIIIQQCTELDVSEADCEAAYKEAVTKAIQDQQAEQFNSAYSCEIYNGGGTCVENPENGMWLPLAGGMIISELIDEYGDHLERKFYRQRFSDSTKPISNNRIVKHDDYNSQLSNSTSSTYSQPKPEPQKKASAKTVSRGGWGFFSSSSSSRSSWGG